jgi:hypothetical protein
VRQAVCLRDDDEAPPGHPHWRKTILMQSLREAIHAKGKPQGKKDGKSVRFSQCASVAIEYISTRKKYHLIL